MKNNALILEQEKDETERGEDLIYILNHAAACGIVDVLNTPVEMLTQHYLNQKISISYCGACASADHEAGFFSANGHENLALRTGRWLIAEQVGDWLGAYPTLMLQRHAPEVMNGIGRALTYVLGDAFSYGATNNAQQWGAKYGFAADSPEVENRANEHYTHEMTHLAQAFVWTGFSTAITLATLKLMGDDSPLWVNASAKMAGVSTSFIGVLGTRALFPEAAQNWDKWGSEHLYKPATKVLGNALGIEDHTIEKVLRNNDEYRDGSKWLGKINDKPITSSHYALMS